MSKNVKDVGSILLSFRLKNAERLKKQYSDVTTSTTTPNDYTLSKVRCVKFTIYQSPETLICLFITRISTSRGPLY